MATTYVDITRDEFEDWLDTEAKARGHWKRDPKTQGVYIVSLSSHVGIKILSTISSQSQTMGHGDASMKMMLVSLITGQVLNKKGMGQSHFKRTVNWRTTWLKGLTNLKGAYQKATRFYEVRAIHPSLEDYQQHTIKEITSVPGWQDNDFLQSLHSQVSNGGILSEKQEAAMRNKTQGKVSLTPSEEENTQKEGYISGAQALEMLRGIWLRSKEKGDTELMNWAADLGNTIKKVPQRNQRPFTSREWWKVQQALKDLNLNLDPNTGKYRG